MQLDSSGVSLQPYRGGLALLGPALEAAYTSFASSLPLPPHPLHVTLLSGAESKGLRSRVKAAAEPAVPTDHIYVLGLAQRKGVAWLVVTWNHADGWRASHGLGKKDYHVTLSDGDDHELDKSLTGWAQAIGDEAVLDCTKHLGVDGLDHICLVSPVTLVC